MSENFQIELNTSFIQEIPIHTYNKNFSFIVNGKEFKTSRLVANLISPTICKMQLTDPTISHFIIDTKNKGDFQKFLNLINFQKNVYTHSECPFIEEIIQILGNNSLIISRQKESTEINLENAFNQLHQYEKHPILNSQFIREEIDFISSHFFNFSHENLIEELLNLDIEKIESIFNNSKLLLDTEDQLISIINELYQTDIKYSNLYEYVNFVNLSEVAISDFLTVFNTDDMTASTWKKISERLQKQVFLFNSDDQNRYRQAKQGNNNHYYVYIPYKKESKFDGIINYIRKSSKNNILNEIDITSSSVNGNYFTSNVIDYDNKESGFSTNDEENSWICIDFKKYSLIPTSYTIRSFNTAPDYSHPKGWVIEGSNDNKNFDVLDEQSNCSYLNGNSLTHTFKIEKNMNMKYRFLRMRITMRDWFNGYHLDINAIEFNGILFS